MSTRTPSLVCFGCSDIVNNQRTQVYVNWAQRQGKFDPGCCPKVDFAWCEEDTCAPLEGVVAAYWTQEDDQLDFSFSIPLPSAPAAIVLHGPNGLIPPSTPVIIEGVVIPADDPGVTSVVGSFTIDPFMLAYLGSFAAVQELTSVDFLDGDGNIIMTWTGSLTIDGAESDLSVSSFTVAGICFTDPVTDEACWFDPNYPESADFLGVYVNDMDGMENDNYARAVSPNLGDGSSFGRGSLGGKTLTFDVLLFATSCAGLEWGRRWLQRTLRGSGCNHATRGTGKCGTHELKIRACCPTETGADAGIRIFPRVALTAGVVRTDPERRDACCDVYQRFSFAISTSTAAAFGELEDACIDNMPDPANQICFDWDGCAAPVTAGCRCTATCDGSCPETLFAPPTLVDDFACGPYEQVTNCCCISGSASSSIGSAMVMELFAGSDNGNPGFMQSGATEVLVRFYPNPKMLPCPTTEEELELFQAVSEVCAEISSCRIPAGATLRIDSRTGEALIECEGTVTPVYDNVRGDLTKIQAGCYDVIACVTWNAWAVVYDPPVGDGAPSSFSIRTAARFE